VSYSHYDRVFLCRSDSAGNWPDSVILGPGPSEGRLRGLAGDNRGNVWVAWGGNPYGPDSGIYAACLDTSLHWSSVYTISHSGFFCNMEIDGDNKVWVVWDADSNFYYRVWDGSEWSPPDSIVAPPASSSFMDAIFYDPARDRIWLSYRTDYEHTFVTWTDPSAGTAERESGPSYHYEHALVVSGVLLLPRDMTGLPGNSDRVPRPVLLDVSGREVLDLHPGANDVRHLAPGIYFVHSTLDNRQSKMTKVVVAR